MEKRKKSRSSQLTFVVVSDQKVPIRQLDDRRQFNSGLPLRQNAVQSIRTSRSTKAASTSKLDADCFRGCQDPQSANYTTTIRTPTRPQSRYSKTTKLKHSISHNNINKAEVHGKYE